MSRVYEHAAETMIGRLRERAAWIDFSMCSGEKQCLESELMKDAAKLIDAMENEIICLTQERDEARKQAGEFFSAWMKASGMNDESTTDAD